MRPPSSVRSAIDIPLPGSPSRSAGVSSNDEVGGRGRVQPELLLLARDREAVGARAHDERADAARPSRAKTRNVEACEPLVIHCLAPVSRPSAQRVRIALASEPEPASVSANAPSSSPAASAGDATPSRGRAAAACTRSCAPRRSRRRPRRRARAPRARARRRGSRRPRRRARPARTTPISPSSPSSANSSRGNVCSRSHSAARGAIFSSAKRRASERISCCSGVSSCRLTTPPAAPRASPAPPSAAAPASAPDEPQPPVEPLEAQDLPALLARDPRQRRRRG